MSDDAAAERKAAQAARQAKLLAKSQERLAKITGAAPAGRIPNDGQFIKQLELDLRGLV